MAVRGVSIWLSEGSQSGCPRGLNLAVQGNCPRPGSLEMRAVRGPFLQWGRSPNCICNVIIVIIINSNYL